MNDDFEPAFRKYDSRRTLGATPEKLPADAKEACAAVTAAYYAYWAAKTSADERAAYAELKRLGAADGTEFECGDV